MTNAGKDVSNRKNYFYRHLLFASQILEKYKGGEPFHLFLKNYFRQNKKHGSRDRKEIASLCYNYFRLGAAVNATVSVESKLLLGNFLLLSQPSPLLETLAPEWSRLIMLPLPEKFQAVKEQFVPDNIFPFKEFLSPQIETAAFTQSFLKQPLTFARIRPGKNDTVIRRLEENKIDFTVIADDCLAFSPSFKVSDLLKVNKDIVIQDMNSQKTGSFLYSLKERGLKVWDCCAASGGKSILALDILDSPQLTVTDSRQGILKNLEGRFRQAGIRHYRKKVADLSRSSAYSTNSFDIVIADVPCSGSGTWARTPEQLQYFTSHKILEYTQLQRAICLNVVPALKPGGHFLYITCSVFKAENEENVQWLETKGLQLLQQEYFKGYNSRADTLFAAFFQRHG